MTVRVFVKERARDKLSFEGLSASWVYILVEFNF